MDGQPDRMDVDPADDPPVYRVYDPDPWDGGMPPPPDAPAGHNNPGPSTHHASHAHPPSSSRIHADPWAAPAATHNHATHAQHPSSSSRMQADPWAAPAPPHNHATHAQYLSSSSRVNADPRAAFASNPQHPPPPPEDNSPILFYDRHQRYFEFTNFSDHSIEFEGRTYPTSEHLFQAHKFTPAHPDLAERIRTLPAPRDALREATRLQRMRRADWFDVNVSIMDMVLERKFTQHSRLRRLLLGTGTRELVENSPRDAFWGIGADGKGRNELGKSLMRVRQKLQGHV